MWKSFNKSDVEPPYCINVKMLNNKYFRNISMCTKTCYKISVTNYVKLWSGVFESDDIISMVMESNKDIKIEGDEQRFLQVGLEMLNNPQQLYKAELTETGSTVLTISLTYIPGIVVCMKFNLSACSAEAFYNAVTQPLLQIIVEQKERETEMRKQVDGIRGYLNKIPKEILMRYEKQDIEDYKIKPLQTSSVMENMFGKSPEEGIDPSQILKWLPPFREGDFTNPESSTASSNNTSSAIKTEPERPSSQLTNESISLETKQVKVESNLEPKLEIPIIKVEPKIEPVSTENSQSIDTKSDIKHESKTQSQDQVTPKNSLNEQEVKTENGESSQLLSSQTNHSLPHRQPLGYVPKKKRKNLNY